MNPDFKSPGTDLSDYSEDFPSPQLLLQGGGNDILTEAGGNFEQRQEIAENLLGDVEWLTPCMGEVACPGADLHTNAGADRVRVYIDNVPTIHCFHSSCERVLAEANRELRSRTSRFERGRNVPRTAVGLGYLQAKVKNREINEKLYGWNQWFNQVVSKPLHPRFLYENSPTDIDQRLGDDRFLFLRLYNPNDLIWTGEIRDTGPKHFSTARRLIEEKRLRHHHVSTCTFKPESQRRTTKNVLSRRFLVVESDELSIPQQTALLWALRSEWKLAAVVYSGSKSLHGWFRWSEQWNDPLVQKEIKARLKAYHCDASSLRATQPYRLPGVMRKSTLKMQSLVYYNAYYSYAKI